VNSLARRALAEVCTVPVLLVASLLTRPVSSCDGKFFSCLAELFFRFLVLFGSLAVSTSEIDSKKLVSEMTYDVSSVMINSPRLITRSTQS